MVKLTLSIDDENYDAFKDLMLTNSVSIQQQIMLLEDAAKTELDLKAVDNIKAYIAKNTVQFLLIEEILKNLPDRPKEKNRIVT